MGHILWSLIQLTRFVIVEVTFVIVEVTFVIVEGTFTVRWNVWLGETKSIISCTGKSQKNKWVGRSE